MSEGSRPGGLTALAVINFVFGGFAVMGAFGGAAVLMIQRGVIEVPAEIAQHNQESIEAMGETAFLVNVVSLFVSASLLIPAGVGYLRQSRFWGRTLGNLYALQSLGLTAAVVWLIREHRGDGPDLGLSIWVIFPLLTLFLLNSTFKEDFVR